MIFLRKYKKYSYKYVDQKVPDNNRYQEFIKNADLQGIFLNSRSIGVNTLSTTKNMIMRKNGNIGYTYRYNTATNKVTAIQVSILKKAEICFKVIEYDVDSDTPEMVVEKYHSKNSPEYKKQRETRIIYGNNKICLCGRHYKVK